MEEVLSEFSSRFVKFLENNSLRESSFLFDWQDLIARMGLELGNIKNECFEERERLNNADVGFQEKLREISEGMEEIEQLSHIGIDTFLELQKYFHRSIEQFLQELESGEMHQRTPNSKRDLLNKIELVKIDASRLLETLKEKLEKKVDGCVLIIDERVNLRVLSKTLNDSIHLMNSKISVTSESISDSNFDEIKECIENVDKNSEKLVMELSRIQGEQRDIFKKEVLKFDTYGERFKYLEGRKDAVLAASAEKMASKTISEFVRNTRTKNGKLELNDTIPFLYEINRIWRSSYDEGIQTEFRMINDAHTSITAELEKLKQSKTLLKTRLKKSESAIKILQLEVKNMKKQVCDSDEKNQELEKQLKDQSNKLSNVRNKLAKSKNIIETIEEECDPSIIADLVKLSKEDRECLKSFASTLFNATEKTLRYFSWKDDPAELKSERDRIKASFLAMKSYFHERMEEHVEQFIERLKQSPSLEKFIPTNTSLDYENLKKDAMKWNKLARNIFFGIALTELGFVPEFVRLLNFAET